GGCSRVRSVHSRQRREGLSGPRQGGAPRRHESHPIGGNAGRYEHSQRRDAQVRPVRIRGRRTGEQVMRKTWVLAAAVVLLAAAAIGGVVATSGGGHATPAAQASAVNTATVDRGTLSDMVSQYGILTYRARSDGSPYAVINRAGGTYT